MEMNREQNLGPNQTCQRVDFKHQFVDSLRTNDAANILNENDGHDMPLETDSQEVVEQVVHIQIEQDRPGRQPHPNGTEVILVYQDILTCGVCSKQFTEILEFLEHRTEHTTRNNFHYCELCKMVFADQMLLICHYQDHHKVPDFGSNIKTNEHNTNLEQPEHLMSANEQHHSIGSVTAESTSSQLIDGDQATGKEGIDSFSLTSPKSTIEQTGKDVTQTDIDDFNFILVTDMIKGPTFSYGKTSFKCLHCDYKTQYKNSIKKHMKEKHEDVLGINQKLQSKETETVNGHQEKLVRMSTYSAQLTRVKPFRKHKRPRPVEKQDLPGVFSCEHCNKIFNRLRYLRKHLETHRLEKKFLCDECGKSFKSRTYLSVHRKVHQAEGKLFKCTQCDFTSRINAAIHAHRQLHSQGSVLCDICGYAYTDKSTLNKHKRVHDVTRPYACTFPACTWRFKTETMCKAHIRAHTTEGKFRCRDCGYVFRQKHHLLRHETNMHGIKHTKLRSNSTVTSHTLETIQPDLRAADTVNLIITPSDIETDHLQLPQQQMVVAADQNGTPITYESTDLTAFNVAMQTFMQPADSASSDSRTVLLSHTDTAHIMDATENASTCSADTRNVLTEVETNHIIFK